MRNRLDTSALMGRVHRELQERFRRAPQGPVDGQAGHFETPCGGVLSELHGERANGRRLSATCGATRQRREDIRRNKKKNASWLNESFYYRTWCFGT
jgi:hypothetical protein